MDWTAIREQARSNMTAAGWMYNEGAADIGGQADYDTLAWRRYGIATRAWHDVTHIDTSTTLGDIPISTPIIGSPTAYHRLASPHGEITSELGAQAAGTFIVYPTNASVAVEEFAAHVNGPWWAQVYLFRDRDVSARYLERVVKAGATALMLTTDCPGFVRDFGFRNGIDHTDEGGSGNFPTMTMGDWTLHLATDLTPDDIVWLKERFGLPVWVKGILRPEDAVATVEAGASGIMVSNHGRRQVDGVVPVAWALPKVAAAVGRRVPILADSGIRSGGDVFRALALGASAVGLGRGIQWAMASAGPDHEADGVKQVIETLTDELAHLMSAAGVSRIADIDSSFVVPEQGPAAIAGLQPRF
ncbi:MAG: alpha-hydroxy acid oxidase [Propionibacterium sp.]